MKKELLISAKFDTQDFDRSVESMQKKLKEIYAPADQVRMQTQTAGRLQQAGYGGVMSGPGAGAMEATTLKQRRDLEASIREQATGQEKLSKIIAQRMEKLEKMKKVQDELNKGSAEELAIKEKIARIEENNGRLREVYKSKDQALNQALDIKAKSPFMTQESLQRSMGMGGGAGGSGSSASGFGGMNPAALLKTVAALLGGSAEIYRQVYESPMKTKVSTGNAMQGTFGDQLQQQYSGQIVSQMAFIPEAQRAAKMASEQMAGSRTYDKLLLAGGTAGLAATPGAFAAGGLPGLITGGLSAGALLSSERMRSLTAASGFNAVGDGLNAFGSMGIPGAKAAGNWMHSLGDSQMAQYNAKMAEEFATNFQKALASEKQQNPLKRLATDEYQQNYQRNLDFQRSLGLNYNSMHGVGGFREQAINAGFSDTAAMGMSQNILGAGGSTRMARNSAFGLQLQRGANLTNASSVLGTLSGSMGSSEATKQATIKILAEGTKLGLDDSKFSEENRKFADMAAQAISRSGTTSNEGVDQVLSKLGGFMTDKTTRGLEAGKNAYEMYQGVSTASNGPQGVMRAAGLLRDDKIGKMNTMDRMALANLPDNQLTEDNDTIQDLSRRYNVDPKDLISRRSKIDQGAVNRSARGSELQKQISELKKKKNLTSILDNPNASKSDKDLMMEYETQLRAQSGQIMDSRTLKAYAEGTTGGNLGSAGKILEDAKAAQIENKKTGRPEDETVQATAESSRLILETFRGMRTEIAPTTEAVAGFNKELQKTVEIIMKMPEAKRGDMIDKMFGGMFGGKTQTNGEKPSQ